MTTQVRVKLRAGGLLLLAVLALAGLALTSAVTSEDLRTTASYRQLSVVPPLVARISAAGCRSM